MAIKRIFLGSLFLSLAMPLCYAQTASDVIKSINKVKCDTMYIYAESTTKNLSEAYNNARTLLEVKVGDWVREQHLLRASRYALSKQKNILCN